MITLAGVELSIDDPEGVLAGWVNQFLPLGEMRDQAKPLALTSQRTGPRTSYEPGVALPLPNYSDPPAPKVSTLYWPTGASRWARGYFLASTDQMQAVVAQTNDLNSPLTLVLTDQTSGASVTAQGMYLMPPRPLSNMQNAQNVYLLPLVDARYWWQFVDVAALAFTLGQYKWQDLYDQAMLFLQILIQNDPVLATYFVPDPDAWSRSYENVALLLDALAHSVGQRIVRQLDGSVQAMTWQTSEGIYNGTDSLLANAGGDFSALNPAAANPGLVAVSFTKWREGAVDPGGDQFVEDNPCFTASTAGAIKTIFTSAFADFTSKGALPGNESGEVIPLSAQITSDYYGYQKYRYDYAVPSLVAGRLSGYDDFALWTFGSLVAPHPKPAADDDDDRPCFTYQASTRLQSQAPNFGVSEQLSQFPDTPVYPNLTRYTLTAALKQSDLTKSPPVINSASAVHRKWVAGTKLYTDTSDKLTVYEVLGKISGAIGDRGWAEYKGDSLRWEAVTGGGSMSFAAYNLFIIQPYVPGIDPATVPTFPARIGPGYQSNAQNPDFSIDNTGFTFPPIGAYGTNLTFNKSGLYCIGYTCYATLTAATFQDKGTNPTATHIDTGGGAMLCVLFTDPNGNLLNPILQSVCKVPYFNLQARFYDQNNPPASNAEAPATFDAVTDVTFLPETSEKATKTTFASQTIIRNYVSEHALTKYAFVWVDAGSSMKMLVKRFKGNPNCTLYPDIRASGNPGGNNNMDISPQGAIGSGTDVGGNLTIWKVSDARGDSSEDYYPI